jgi:hypothetical protein
MSLESAQSLEETIIDERQAVTKPTTSISCPACEKNNGFENSFCEGCGYPLQGTEAQQKVFMYQRSYKHLDLHEVNKKIEKATNSLYALAAFSVISGILFYAATPEENNPLPVLIANMVLSAIYLTLALFSKKQAVAAIVSGLSLFVVVQLLNMILEPASIVRGIIFKIAIFIYLIKGVQSAFEAQKIKRQLNVE